MAAEACGSAHATLKLRPSPSWGVGGPEQARAGALHGVEGTTESGVPDGST
eukprot:CAMPEP_0171287550 /NCGR_PEP_ID=MMETSP0790-20130122/69616_1 /TAXON_ID=2925 /ORGANISM="Alexandrium catenella, Strain OF101" /LENGTH=50 /DNA_ID=CAMNT_0011757089 /DNA_START=24 /DNA_END=173 /DNA_ORIENTATION=+